MRLVHAIRSRARAFRHDVRGGVAIWAVLVLPPMLGIAALSIDIARVYRLDAEMQSAADALARAGAFELDGRPDAITRAGLAIEDLVANEQHLGDLGAGEVQVQAVRFLTALPANDSQAVPAAYVTADPRAARFVEVSARPVGLTTLFPPQLVTGMVTTSVSARSVGARHAQMCGAAPLFICNPVEDSGENLGDALASESFRGRLIKLRGKGGNAQYAPGQFGFLQPPGGNGASELKRMFAEISPAACYDSAGVTLRTGAVSSVDHGLNTRFDIYKGGFKRADYPPAAIISSYPQDSCFASGTCTRMGDGVWAFQAYMEANHRTKSAVTIAGTPYTFNHGANTVLPSNKRPSRYDVYRWELEQADLALGDPDRRIMPVAVLNCQSENLSSGDVPVQSFAKVFLTEPMGSGSEDVIWGELVGPLKPGADRQARDQVDVRR